MLPAGEPHRTNSYAPASSAMAIRNEASKFAFLARVSCGLRVAEVAAPFDVPTFKYIRKAILVQILQNGYRYIRVGQPAEIAFEIYPGQIFKGNVNYLLPANASGELTPSGLVAAIKSASQPLLVELTLTRFRNIEWLK